MIAQRPPLFFKRNTCAAQKSLPGNATSECVGENYELGGEKSARRQARSRAEQSASRRRRGVMAVCNCVYGSVPRAVASVIQTEARSLPLAVLTRRIFPYMQSLSALGGA